MKRSLRFIPLALCAISCAADPPFRPRAGDAGMMHAHVTQIFDEKDADDSRQASK